jgi:hypothetical protein
VNALRLDMRYFKSIQTVIILILVITIGCKPRNKDRRLSILKKKWKIDTLILDEGYNGPLSDPIKQRAILKGIKDVSYEFFDDSLMQVKSLTNPNLTAKYKYFLKEDSLYTLKEGEKIWDLMVIEELNDSLIKGKFRADKENNGVTQYLKPLKY